MKLTKKQREELKQKYGGRCAYCGCELGDKWHVDHIVAVERESHYDREERRFVPTGAMRKAENDHGENLNPACIACNIDKGPIDLEGWRLYLQDRIVDGLRRNSSTFRHAERFGMVTVSREPLVFWFEKYEAEREVAA